MAFLVMAAAGCTKLTADQAGAGESAPKVTLAAIAPTLQRDVNKLEVNVVKAGDGFNVQVAAGTRMPEQDELYFKVAYDGTKFHVYGIDVTGIKADTGVMGLAHENGPGLVDVGLVATKLATSPAVKPGDALVSLQLIDGPARTVSAAEGNLVRARNLELTETDGAWKLSWDYTNPGDTNQDGMVTVNDLTPIGMHYGETVGNSWDDPLRHVDGDHNGEINLGDITPLGQNYATQIWAYQIEMSQDGTTGFETVGQLELGDFRANPGETVRFEYTFPGQYVPHAWYRVVPVAPMTNPDTGQAEIVRGTPSDAISEDGRTADPVDVPNGATVTIVLSVTDLPVPITNLNCARVIYPAGYEYVKGSANAGSPGGAADALDGIWSSFATTLLMPPDAMIKTRDYGGGMLATDFNVSVLEKALPAAPAGYGDLLNFKLKQTGSAPLTIGFQTVSDDSVKRTYYSSQDGTEYYFGNSLSYSISVGAGTAGQQAETNGN